MALGVRLYWSAHRPMLRWLINLRWRGCVAGWCMFAVASGLMIDVVTARRSTSIPATDGCGWVLDCGI